MKKEKLIAVLTGVMLSIGVTGCSRYEYQDDHIKIPQYTKIEVDAPEETTVTETDVQDEIQSILDSHAQIKTVDRKAKVGDIVILDFQRYVDGKELEDSAASDYEVEIGAGSLIDGFEDSIIGHKTGDRYDWNGQFPENYTDDLSGKAVRFHIVVKEIREKTLPTYDDTFVKTVSKTSTTIKEYEKEIEAELKSAAKDKTESELGYSAMDAVLESTEVIEYPKKELSSVLKQMKQQYTEAAESSGSTYEDFVKDQLGYEIEDFESDLKESAKMQVKEQMVVDAISKEENLTDSSEDEFLTAAAKDNGFTDAQEMIDAIGEESADAYAKSYQVRSWLGDHATIKETEK